MRILLLFLVGSLFSAASLRANEPAPISAAIDKALPLLARAAAGSAAERTCFTCHSQALPVFALAAAREHGFTIDEKVFQAQVEHTLTFVKGSRQRYLDGRGTGGKVDLAGYALWTLDDGKHPRDENTDAVIEYLLAYRADSPSWPSTSNRPPSQGSHFTTTYLALRGLGSYAAAEHRAGAEKRQAAAEEWLLATPAKTTEDHVFRLRSLHYLGVDTAEVISAADALLALQRTDGGWSQTADMESDAYATGTALVALAECDRLEPVSAAYQRGIDFLLKTQLPDGSWRVTTRSKPIQKYFETGFPHEKDQFISTTATAWAVQALLKTTPLADAAP
ncbi:prenyltransferase/squalene oxidase repeat-containing protein [Lignipirellula cremea]|uniref:prenyltransferase/squalene oxidase repeat-containing protein n=1 Tax=Lignipirellula cremea TaxID=2528010 RepID=UPI0018D230CA|nr:prenyltransferase/squalene oxidase repeat-containing protein [Lignipirellula cremea]